MHIDFSTKRIIEKLKNKELISVQTILDICTADEYLPNNRADAYFFLNKLVILKVVIREKRGVYLVNKENLDEVIK